MAVAPVDIQSRLQVIAEELADLAIERLRESIETGDGEAAAEEKRITRARRSVEKAAALLGSDAENFG